MPFDEIDVVFLELVEFRFGNLAAIAIIPLHGIEVLSQTGILETIVRPGFYAKTGLVFDFAKSDYKLNALEVGLQVQMVFPFIQQMAFNPAKKVYLTGYLTYNFGKKKGRNR